jgi:hypothetical protein
MTINYNPAANIPWPQVTNHLNKKYSVLATYNLDQYDGQMSLLYHHLHQFQDYAFSPREKIIFYHFETNFYVNNLSLQLYNFQMILNQLKIPRFACILLTAHYGVDKEISNLEDQFSCDSTKMQVWTSSYVQILSNPIPEKNNKSDHECIKYPFLCLNGTQRVHRIMLLCLLQKYNLLDQGLISYHFSKKNSNHLLTSTESHNNHSCLLLNSIPFSRTNEYVVWNKEISDAFDTWGTQFIGKTFLSPEISDYNIDCLPDLHFKKSFLYVAAETVFNYPHQFITEKVFKGFLNRRPFVVVAAAGTLAQLRKLGFKTFDSIIDESYDLINDPSERLLAVTNIIKKFCGYSITKLQQIADSIEDVLKYNYYHYVNIFCKIDLLQKLNEL